jgi:hypothetical protein
VLSHSVAGSEWAALSPSHRDAVPAHRLAKGEEDITEREATILLAEFATVWNELLPVEQTRVVQLLLARVDVREEALEVRIRVAGS